MNIVLIRPPKITGAFEKILIQEPINLAYLAAHLKKHGFNVQIWDFEVEPFSEDLLKGKIRPGEIEIAGITSMTPTIVNAGFIAKSLKKIDKSIITVAGGPHVSALPEQTLNDFIDFDYVIAGEGEIPLAEFCNKIKGKKALTAIPGLFSVKNNLFPPDRNRVYVENLDIIPFPAREIFDPRLYRNIYAAGIDMRGKRSTAIFSSRGCPQNCTFCAVHKTLGQKVRFRSLENVLGEITHCRDDLGYNHFTFEDTNLTLNKDRFLEICRGLKKLRVTWDCQTRVDLVDKKMIETMAECGCLKIAYGVESGSQRILKLMNKNISVPQIINAFYLTRKANISTCAFFILGTHPEENKNDLEETEKLLHKIKPDVFQLSILCPYPGTEIHEIMRKENLLKQTDWRDFNFMHSNSGWGTKFISPSQLKKYQKNIYLRYLLNPAFIFSVFKKIIDPRQILHISKLCLYFFEYLLFERQNRKKQFPRIIQKMY